MPLFRARTQRPSGEGTSVPSADGRPVSRKAIAVVVSVLLVLSGSGAAYAVWTATASTSAAASAARVGVTQQVVGLDTVYPSGFIGITTTTGTVVTTNSGSVPGTYSISASPLGELASAVAVKAWKTTGDCAAVPSGIPTGSWLTLPAMTGSLAPGQSATWCVQTSLEKAVALQQWGKSVAVTLSAALATASPWTATAPATVISQSAGTADAAVPAPATPRLTVCTTTNNGQRVDLVWTPVSDTSTYTVAIAGPAPGTVTVKTLTPGTSEQAQVTKQEIILPGTYVITVYTGTLPIATDRLIKYSDGNDGAIRCDR